MSLRVAIFTVGCRANQADSEQLARALDPAAVELVGGDDEFELAVINTCCVTANAERDCRKLARRARRHSPDARVVLTGCAVSADVGLGASLDHELEQRGGGDDDPRELARWINELAGARPPTAGADAEFAGAASRRTRALLKVQNGCTHGCAYCVVPAARGPERSTPLAEVVERAERLADAGVRELVLTGVQLGAWGVDLGRSLGIADLLREVADRFAPGRVRLSSIEPWSVDERLIEVVTGHERVCPHLHVPLQSGDDRILDSMSRGYHAADVIEIAELARLRCPELALGTDVLVGFPGEDRTAFANTLALLEEIGPAYVHAFPFSPRPGTRAAAMSSAAESSELRARVSRTIELGRESSRRFRRQQAGRVREVIVEQADADGPTGLTDTFVPVRLAVGGSAVGDLVQARLELGDDSARMTAIPVAG